MISWRNRGADWRNLAQKCVPFIGTIVSENGTIVPVCETRKPLKTLAKNPVTIEITGFVGLAEKEGFEPVKSTSKPIENKGFAGICGADLAQLAQNGAAYKELNLSSMLFAYLDLSCWEICR